MVFGILGMSRQVSNQFPSFRWLDALSCGSQVESDDGRVVVLGKLGQSLGLYTGDLVRRLQAQLNRPASNVGAFVLQHLFAEICIQSIDARKGPSCAESSRLVGVGQCDLFESLNGFGIDLPNRRALLKNAAAMANVPIVGM